MAKMYDTGKRDRVQSRGIVLVPVEGLKCWHCEKPVRLTLGNCGLCRPCIEEARAA